MPKPIAAIDVHNTLLSETVFPVEFDGEGPFHWTHMKFALRPPQGHRYLALQLGNPTSEGVLTVPDGQSIATSLVSGWHWYSLDFGPSPSEVVELIVDPAGRDLGDPRPLGVMLRSVEWHNSAERHSRIERARANTILNDEEYQSGAAVMRSFPPYLRLTIEVRCNIASDKACVYCSWKYVKNEEAGAPTYDLSFIKSLDPYVSAAKVVNDCSYGEPPLNTEFAEIVDLIATDERAFSFASNGKTMRRKVRQALLGRNVLVYISIDSATAAGYARYRDHSFDRIIADLRMLCREKKSHRDLPHVTVSFIVMNSNKHEVREFIALMHSVGVDRVKLMNLGLEARMELDGRVQQRGSFVFDYDREIVAGDELDEIARVAQVAADELGVDLYIDWQGFRSNHGAKESVGRQPLCSEPWKSLYVLNRGIIPCCFGREPIARWSERGDRSVEQFVEDTRNGAAMQDLRRSLADGVFPAYCKSSLNCPLVWNSAAEQAPSAVPASARPPASL